MKYLVLPVYDTGRRPRFMYVVYFAYLTWDWKNDKCPRKPTRLPWRYEALAVDRAHLREVIAQLRADNAPSPGGPKEYALKVEKCRLVRGDK